MKIDCNLRKSGTGENFVIRDKDKTKKILTMTSWNVRS